MMSNKQRLTTTTISGVIMTATTFMTVTLSTTISAATVLPKEGSKLESSLEMEASYVGSRPVENLSLDIQLYL